MAWPVRGIAYDVATGVTVTAGTPYGNFVANYGYPALARESGPTPTALTPRAKPYVLCTTCHNQHVMTVYASSAKSPIAEDGGGNSTPPSSS